MTAQTPSLGSPVLSAGGQPIATVAALGLDPASGRAEWIVVRTVGGRTTAVPSYVASVNASGGLVIPYGAADLEAAPTAAGDVLTSSERAHILEHFGLTA